MLCLLADECLVERPAPTLLRVTAVTRAGLPLLVTDRGSIASRLRQTVGGQDPDPPPAQVAQAFSLDDGIAHLESMLRLRRLRRAGFHLIDVRRRGSELYVVFRWRENPHRFGIRIPLDDTGQGMLTGLEITSAQEWAGEVQGHLEEELMTAYVARAGRRPFADYIELSGTWWVRDSAHAVDRGSRPDLGGDECRSRCRSLARGDLAGRPLVGCLGLPAHGGQDAGHVHDVSHCPGVVRRALAGHRRRPVGPGLPRPVALRPGHPGGRSRRGPALSGRACNPGRYAVAPAPSGGYRTGSCADAVHEPPLENRAYGCAVARARCSAVCADWWTIQHTDGLRAQGMSAPNRAPVAEHPAPHRVSPKFLRLGASCRRSRRIDCGPSTVLGMLLHLVMSPSDKLWLAGRQPSTRGGVPQVMTRRAAHPGCLASAGFSPEEPSRRRPCRSAAVTRRMCRC